MNKLIKIMFISYHLIFKNSIAVCRYDPTCSRYLVEATIKHGTIKGLYLASKRMLSCHPFSTKPIYDPA